MGQFFSGKRTHSGDRLLWSFYILHNRQQEKVDAWKSFFAVLRDKSKDFSVSLAAPIIAWLHGENKGAYASEYRYKALV